MVNSDCFLALWVRIQFLFMMRERVQRINYVFILSKYSLVPRLAVPGIVVTISLYSLQCYFDDMTFCILTD